MPVLAWRGKSPYQMLRDLPLRGQNHDALILEADALYQAVAVLKQDLMAKSQASELFAHGWVVSSKLSH
jgi:hypothetical protein